MSEELDRFMNRTLPTMIQRGLYNQWRREDQEAETLEGFLKGVNMYTPTKQILERMESLDSYQTRYAKMQKDNVMSTLSGIKEIAVKRDKLTEDYLTAIDATKNFDYSTENVSKIMQDFTKGQIEAEGLRFSEKADQFKEGRGTYLDMVGLGRQMQVLDIDKDLSNGLQLAEGKITSPLAKEQMQMAMEYLPIDPTRGAKMFRSAMENEAASRPKPKVGQAINKAYDESGKPFEYQMIDGRAINLETGRPVDWTKASKVKPEEEPTMVEKGKNLQDEIDVLDKKLEYLKSDIGKELYPSKVTREWMGVDRLKKDEYKKLNDVIKEIEEKRKDLQRELVELDVGDNNPLGL